MKRNGAVIYIFLCGAFVTVAVERSGGGWGGARGGSLPAISFLIACIPA